MVWINKTQTPNWRILNVTVFCILKLNQNFSRIKSDTVVQNHSLNYVKGIFALIRFFHFGNIEEKKFIFNLNKCISLYRMIFSFSDQLLCNIMLLCSACCYAFVFWSEIGWQHWCSFDVRFGSINSQELFSFLTCWVHPSIWVLTYLFWIHQNSPTSLGTRGKG
jgi:hypothetical protein